ncbi:phage head spike fiber domain-containing protein [Leclercia adecarboxylata]|uniref:phage head spike fiber domain-containing protein n=1 Tax=Leclercia adecarboxylata TaxID=83655 RepID=UPI0022E2A6AA|nr:LamG-like jellyroll fold domain-containing protein [Leclercia adecarboxylata]MDU6819724.1 LamG-like jellyroll fold domain-containing protein [Leclercia adecarboxylata]WJT05095.1 LamG domain-containing protein [Leclercia adecarboxylata]
MATLDDDLAKAVSEGFRLAQSSIINQDLILSGTGDVTVTLADGSKKTGPSWSKLIAAATAAGTSAAAAKTSETNALASKNAAATSATNAATSEGNALASKNAAKTSETNAKTSETNAKTSETNAAASASSAAASLAAAQLLTSVPYEEAPFPDVWAPLNDDLRLLAGFAPYDRLTISGQVLELPTKSLTFSRATTATYIDKSGVLRIAAINEPRFEKEGLLIEGQSTNLAVYSSPTQDYSSYFRSGANNTRTFKPEGGVLLTTLTDTGTWWEQNINVANYDPTKPASVSCYLEFPAAAKVRVMLMRYSSEGDIAAASITAAPGVNKVSVPVLGGAVNQRLGLRITVDAGTPVSSVIFIDRMQIEGSAQATSYIPTDGAAATRAADDCTLQRSGNDNYFGPVTFAMEVHCNGRTMPGENTNSRRGIISYYPSSTEWVFAALNASATTPGKPVFCYASPALVGGATAIDDGEIHNMSFVSDTINKKVCTDGAVVTSDTITRPTPGNVSAANNTIYIGRGAGSSTPGVRMLNGHIRNLRIWHRALTDNQINGLR